MKKTYELNWNNSFFITIQLDHEKDLEQIFKEMNNFWADSDDRLNAYDGNIIHVGIKLIADKAFCLIAEGCFGIEHLKSKFEAEEGYCHIDGSSGIEIIDYYWCGLDDSVITITEVNYE